MPTNADAHSTTVTSAAPSARPSGRAAARGGDGAASIVVSVMAA
jgi:hypothetical protein